MKNDSRGRVQHVAALLVAVAAVVYCVGLSYQPVIRPLLDVVPPFAIALVIAFLLDPVVDWLQARGLSRGMGVAVVGFSFLIAFALVGMLLLPRMVEQATGLAANFQGYMISAKEQVNGLLASEKPLLIKLHLPTTTAEWSSRYSSQIEAGGQQVLEILSMALSTAASRLLWLVIIPLSSLVLLKDFDYIKAKVVHLTPEKHRERLVSVGSAVVSVFARYVRGMLVVALLYGLIASVVLTAFGLKYALIVGFIAGIFYLVPYLGNIVIIGMAVVAVMVQAPHSGATAAMLALILAVQSMVVFDLLITPKVAGGSVGVHPVLALFSLALGARMFGIVGLVMAVPVVASLQVAIGQMYPAVLDDLRSPKGRKRQSDKCEISEA